MIVLNGKNLGFVDPLAGDEQRIGLVDGIPPDDQPPRKGSSHCAPQHVKSELVIFVCVPETSNEIERRMSSSLFSRSML